MKTAVKTERITILGTPEFKDFLIREAKQEGVSLKKDKDKVLLFRSE
jgi:hypothetical protein